MILKELVEFRLNSKLILTINKCVLYVFTNSVKNQVVHDLRASYTRVWLKGGFSTLSRGASYTQM